MAFKYIVCTKVSRSAARLVRHFFSRLDTPRILSCLRAGHVYEGSFCGDESTDGCELAVGVGSGGGQSGSSAGQDALSQPTVNHLGLKSPWGRGERLRLPM
jgi:hypothetical protein